MVKEPIKPQQNLNTLQNNLNLTSKLDSKLSKKEYKPTPKSKQQIDKEHYQKNKEKKKQQRRERYQQQKLQAQQDKSEQLSKYYGAEAFKVLMNLKTYTELNADKRKKWLDFVWILKELTSDEGKWDNNITDIIQVMRIRELAENLISDYWETAKAEVEKGKKSWGVLEIEQRNRLIKYWGYEKARKEEGYITELERLKEKGREYEKEIELLKLHEERGKVKCSCYSCEEKKEIKAEVKKKIKKELDDHDQGKSDKEECPGCGKLKILDEESGVCKKCLEDYGN